MSTFYQKTSRLRLPYTRILLVFSAICLLCWLFHDDTDPFELEMKALELLEDPEHAFIHSVYYYPTSKSLGDNAVAIVATMNRKAVRDLNKFKVQIVGTNSTDRVVTKARMSTEVDPEGSCEYSTVLIQTNTVKKMGKLELETKWRRITLPVRTPKKVAPKPVVFCIAPLFAAEQWQSLLMQLHVSKKFGAHLHVYMTTLLEQYYQLARELHNLEFLSTQAWLSMKFSQVEAPFAEPNVNSEFRNPAAAYTDCLLQYKEATQFVGFMEVDDLLFPLNANTYYEEFEREYEGSYEISALFYQVIEQQSVKSSSKTRQSIGEVLGNMNTISSGKIGRAIVRPERYNSTWTYFSTQADRQPIYLTEQQEEPHFMKRKEVKTNAVLSFKKMDTIFNSTAITSIPMNPMSPDQKLLTKEQTDSIDKEIEKTLNHPSLQKIIAKLPTTDFYTSHLQRCLEQQTDKRKCVSIKHCELPNNASLICRHSDALYHSGWKMMPYTFHFATEPYFTRNLGCYH